MAFCCRINNLEDNLRESEENSQLKLQQEKKEFKQKLVWWYLIGKIIWPTNFHRSGQRKRNTGNLNQRRTGKWHISQQLSVIGYTSVFRLYKLESECADLSLDIRRFRDESEKMRVVGVYFMNMHSISLRSSRRSTRSQKSWPNPIYDSAPSKRNLTDWDTRARSIWTIWNWRKKNTSG